MGRREIGFLKVGLTIGLMALQMMASTAQPDYKYQSKDIYHDQPAKYSFNYAVKDDEYYNDFGHSESRDGDRTDGQYHVLLPDGRVQYVKYYVDGYSGFVAEVYYSGEPTKYDNNYKPAPSYKVDSYAPAPAYKPEPPKPRPTPAAYKAPATGPKQLPSYTVTQKRDRSKQQTTHPSPAASRHVPIRITPALKQVQHHEIQKAKLDTADAGSAKPEVAEYKVPKANLNDFDRKLPKPNFKAAAALGAPSFVDKSKVH